MYPENILKSNNGDLIIINAARTTVLMQLFIELLFAIKFKALGYNVKLLVDDGVLSHHDTLTISDGWVSKVFNEIKVFLTQNVLLTSANFRELVVKYSEIIVTKNVDSAIDLRKTGYIYDGIDFDEYIKASLVRYYKSAPDDSIINAEATAIALRNQFERDAILAYEISRLVLKNMNPSILISSHGIYTTWGVFFKNMCNKNVRCISYSSNGYESNCLDFGLNNISASKHDNGYFQILKKMEEAKKIYAMQCADKLMTKRSSGKSSDIATFQTNRRDSSDYILKIKDKAKCRVVYAIFPNIFWDNATTFKQLNTIFSDSVDWLVYSIEAVLRIPDSIVILRSHPLEVQAGQVRWTLRAIIQHKLGLELLNSDRIIFINSDDDVKSYDLFPLIDVGLVYNGTIGLELMYNKIPVLNGAKAAYSGKGFTYDVTTKSQYNYALLNYSEISTFQASNYRDLKLFIYEYFGLHGIPLKFLSTKKQLTLELSGLNEIISDKNLDFVCNFISGNIDHFQTWISDE